MKKVIGIFAVSAVAFAFAGTTKSGLEKGEEVTPFHPQHVSGPLANTSNCFPCTFKNRPQVQVWVNGDDMKNVGAIAKSLEGAMAEYKKNEFKAMVVFVTSDVDATKKVVAGVAKSTGYSNIAMSVLDKNDAAVKNYKFNTDKSVKNTVFVYKNWKVASKMVNFVADKAGLVSLNSAIAGVAK
ncbi:MAG: hypothetical protein K8R88_01220 [Armatimonadetes bacterium]|nr:hypothetical protein [Armatimonadota bacterium]